MTGKATEIPWKRMVIRMRAGQRQPSGAPPLRQLIAGRLDHIPSRSPIKPLPSRPPSRLTIQVAIDRCHRCGVVRNHGVKVTAVEVGGRGQGHGSGRGLDEALHNAILVLSEEVHDEKHHVLLQVHHVLYGP